MIFWRAYCVSYTWRTNTAAIITITISLRPQNLQTTIGMLAPNACRLEFRHKSSSLLGGGGVGPRARARVEKGKGEKTATRARTVRRDCANQLSTTRELNRRERENRTKIETEPRRIVRIRMQSSCALTNRISASQVCCRSASTTVHCYTWLSVITAIPGVAGVVRGSSASRSSSDVTIWCTIFRFKLEPFLVQLAWGPKVHGAAEGIWFGEKNLSPKLVEP